MFGYQGELSADYLRIAFCANFLAKSVGWRASRVNTKIYVIRRDKINFTQWNGNSPHVIEIYRFNQINNLVSAFGCSRSATDSSDGSALVCWLSGTVEGGALKVRRVQPDGSLGPPAVIAKTDISRSSGFPRMARLGDEVHFAWTEFGKPSYVRTATANISAYK